MTANATRSLRVTSSGSAARLSTPLNVETNKTSSWRSAPTKQSRSWSGSRRLRARRDHVRTVAAGLLGVVQGSVGSGHKIGELAVFSVQGRYSNGDGEANENSAFRVIVDGDRQAGDVLAEAFGHATSIVFAGLRQQEYELLAAKATGEVVTAEMATQCIANHPQDTVADQVPIRIVHSLEMVDVHQCHSERLMEPDRTVHLDGCFLFPSRRIEQSGLGVNPGLFDKGTVHHEAPSQQHRGNRE